MELQYMLINLHYGWNVKGICISALRFVFCEKQKCISTVQKQDLSLIRQSQLLVNVKLIGKPLK